MNKVKILTAAALTITMTMLAGCGEKKIDGSTPESLQKSTTSIYESLPDSKKGEFAQQYAMGRAMGISDKGKTFAQSVDGKTADEMIAYVKKGIEEKTTLRY
ncbi:UNVERIFIED_ORG: hypothetical protein J2W87_001423 [Pseudomonas putida]|nr:hypothetical protein [Pseudomonas putida]